MILLFYTRTLGEKLIFYKETHMTILTILVTIRNTQNKTYHTIWWNESSICIWQGKDEWKVIELKTWLLSCSYPVIIIETAFFNAKLKGPAPKKEEIVILFVSTHSGNFDSKSISITANSLLSNVKDNRFKKVFDKCKVIHALKQPKNLLRLSSKPNVQTCIFEKYGLYRYECKDSHCNLCASYI